MNDKLLIIGASGHGKVVADIALSLKKWQSIAFLDDDVSIKISMGLKVMGKSSDAFTHIVDHDLFVAVGKNSTREKIQHELETAGASIPILIHHGAVLGTEVEIGIGTVIMAGVVINCCTKIGKGCIINTGAILDHDNTIEDYVHISPGSSIAGTVKIGARSWMGTGSTVSNNITINSGCIVGAGAVVIEDIIKPGTYVGIPARRL